MSDTKSGSEESQAETDESLLSQRAYARMGAAAVAVVSDE